MTRAARSARRIESDTQRILRHWRENLAADEARHVQACGARRAARAAANDRRSA
jgi:hypothetical protein